MTKTTDQHRPLLAGVGIEICTYERPQPGARREVQCLRHGTLTGLARRKSNQEPVLVTNQHVLAGGELYPVLRGDTVRFETRILSLARRSPVEMYQGGRTRAHRVGRSPRAYRIVDLPAVNVVDVGSCALMPGVKAAYALHTPSTTTDLLTSTSQPDTAHTARYLISGTREARPWMKLLMLGAVTGEQEVTVADTDTWFDEANQRFKQLIQVAAPKMPQQGDSGAPLVYHDKAKGTYQMVGVFLAAADTTRVYACHAGAVERLHRIEFGKRPPVVKAKASPARTEPNTTVVLDGRDSSDPDGDPLRYKWEFVSPKPVGISVLAPAKESTSFRAPRNWRGTLTFKLTVTNVANESRAAIVRVEIGPATPPKPPAPQPPPDSLTDVNPPGKTRSWSPTPKTRGTGPNRERLWREYDNGVEVDTEWRPDPVPTQGPTTKPATQAPTTEPTTRPPTTRPPTTRPPTTRPPTQAPTTEPPALRPVPTEPTTRPATQRPTTKPATRAPTTEPPALRPEPTTRPPTRRPTTRPPTQRPTTRPPTQRPTTRPPTQAPTTEPPALRPEPTTRPPTTRPPTPAPEVWGSWIATGRERWNGVETEYEERRTSNRGRTQTRWVPG